MLTTIQTVLTDKFSSIRAFVFDMDGVLTDGGLWLTDSGEWLRRMHIRDGYALQLAVRKGYRISVISGSESKPVMARLHRLGVTDVFMQVNEKATCLRNMLDTWGLTEMELLYMGDDVPDLPSMRMAGIAACPCDAARDVRAYAHYISSERGGEGCVRDVIERVLRCQGKWSEESGVLSV